VFDEPDNFVRSSSDFVGLDVVSSKVYYQVSNIVTRISEVRNNSITKPNGNKNEIIQNNIVVKLFKIPIFWICFVANVVLNLI